MDYAFARSRDAAALWKLGASGANMIRRPSICQTSLTEMAAKEELLEQFARIMITFFHRIDPARLPTKTQLRKYSHDQLASMIGAFNRSVE